ncbi:Cleavage/polyadenylation specificity factor A subunit [Venturia nashicola]|uniref:Cleavage/polyadenylation specificity factor A subunit n=1 Tax=Venturia nashicola TaxID=86259 RepID=A0A4Z1PD58_9PEZI|nr:Cleavage/polyadenylation specificity factor A subunit [Venturia nashicola]
MSHGPNGHHVTPVSRTGRITIDQILNMPDDAQAGNLPHRGRRKPAPGVGLLSRTLFKSSMTKWILSARIRSADQHELLFIGENEVRIKEILPNGELRRLTSIKNFPSQIRAAAILGEELELTAMTDDPAIKMEYPDGSPNGRPPASSVRAVTSNKSMILPPQVLVLALESAELRFVIFDASHPDGLHFRQSSFPLPIYKSPKKTPGRTICVDPLARALVVSASSNTILVYDINNRARLQTEYAANPEQWNPISSERQLRVEGNILAIGFLHPGHGNAHLIVLIIVVIVAGVSKLSCWAWTQNQGLKGITPVVQSIRLPKSETKSSATSEFRLPTETASEHCNLMIPMANSPSFLLVHGSDVRICRNVLTGKPDVMNVPQKSWEQDPKHWASSSRRPAYTSWTRCARLASWKNKGNDSLYLIREDGVIRNYTRGNNYGTGLLSNAGQFDCTVSTAVSSFLLHLKHPDFLVAAGNMCNGQVVSFGDGGSSKSRDEAMALRVERIFPDWAPIMDFQIASPSGHNGRDLSKRPNIFATSGRQPYGAISELFKGLEAKIFIEVDLRQYDGLTGSYGLWSFSDPFNGYLHFFLTYPDATTAWSLDTQHGLETCELNLDPGSATLLVAITPNNFVIQVTENALLVSSLAEQSPLSPLKVPDFPQGSRIVAAEFDEESSGLLLAVRSGNRVYLDLFVLPTTLGARAVVRVSAPLALDDDLTSLALFRDQTRLYAVTALRDGMLHMFSIDFATGLRPSGRTSIDQNGSTQITPIAQSILVLSTSINRSRAQRQLIACGLRSGDLFTVEFEMSGHSVDRIPYLVRPKLSAIRKLRQSGVTSTEIACIDGSTLRIAVLDNSLRVVPRRISLNRDINSPDSKGVLVEPSGTPQLLLYSPRLEALIIGSVKYELKARSTTYPGPTAPYLGLRTNRGAFQFMPLDKEDSPAGVGELQPMDKSTLIELLPGEKPLTMVEFRYRRDSERPAYSGYHHFLLAGTKRTHEDGNQTGRLIFLRPTRKQNHTIEVDMPIQRDFDYPIRALAICDTKIVMSGNKIITVYELINVPGRGLRLNTLASANLVSHAINLTTSSPFIRVTTAADSIQTYVLESKPSAKDPTLLHYNLRLFSSDSLAREALTHLPLHVPLPSTRPSRISSSPISASLNSSETPNIVLASDRSGSVFALLHTETQSYQTASQTLFELTLPQCVTHFAKSSAIRPPWRAIADPGVLEANILGSCTDGTVYQFTIIDNETRVLLKFLENLVKWDGEEDLRVAQGGKWTSTGDERIVIDPDWVGGEEKRKTGYAINGDYLEVFLKEGGEAALKGMLTRQEDPVGIISSEWADEWERSRKWNGNEVGMRIKRFEDLLEGILGDDIEFDDLGEKVEKCVEWLAGVMVELL